MLAGVKRPVWPQNQSMTTAESGRGIVSETEGKYSVELFKEGGEGAGQEEIVAPARSIEAGLGNFRGGWSCYATALASWREAIGPRLRRRVLKSIYYKRSRNRRRRDP